MTIKELIKTFEKRNELNSCFNKEHEQLQIVFDDTDYLYFDNLKDFEKYVKDTYYKPYFEAFIAVLLDVLYIVAKLIFVKSAFSVSPPAASIASEILLPSFKVTFLVSLTQPHT